MRVRTGTRLLNPVKLLERSGVRAGQRVADLGCGALGHFVFPAAHMVGGYGVVYAVDIQPAVLEHIGQLARAEQLWNIYPVWADIDVYDCVRIEAGSLDMTLLINNLFLSQDRMQLVREMARLTKPHGRIMVIEWKTISTPIGPPMEQRIDPEAAKHILHSPLFTLIEEFEAGEYHYGLIYLRTDQLSQV